MAAELIAAKTDSDCAQLPQQITVSLLLTLSFFFFEWTLPDCHGEGSEEQHKASYSPPPDSLPRLTVSDSEPLCHRQFPTNPSLRGNPIAFLFTRRPCHRLRPPWPPRYRSQLEILLPQPGLCSFRVLSSFR